MKVTSGLADVDFTVDSISREDSHLVVRDAARGAGVPTVVYVSPQDIVAGLKALLRSPRALALVLTAPFRRQPVTPAPLPGEAWHDDVNNPWL
ncbi:MAG TPA: hypothetical protein VLV29_01525 [Steroidobacteraceae bacterium]|nr:hypothetical protein [Steroidobacteraceae bacterium]